MTSDSFLAVLVRRMAGTGVDDAGGDDVVGLDEDVGGGLVGAGGNAAAVVWLMAALPSGRWVASRKAEAAAHNAITPMSATESLPLAGFVLAGAADNCGAP